MCADAQTHSGRAIVVWGFRDSVLGRCFTSCCPKTAFIVPHLAAQVKGASLENSAHILTVCASGAKSAGFLAFSDSATSCMNETIGSSAAFAQRTKTS